MKAQILKHNGDPKVDEQVRWVRRHSLQFGDGNAFARYIENHCKNLVAVYSGETGRVSIYARSLNGPLGVEPDPLAIWNESPKWSIEPGRLVYLNGQLVCSIHSSIRPDSSLSHADVDDLARKIVDLLNEKGVEL